MERQLRLRYNELSLKRKLLIKETKIIENEMKLIIISHNTRNNEIKYSINKLPYLIYDYDIVYLKVKLS